MKVLVKVKVKVKVEGEGRRQKVDSRRQKTEGEDTASFSGFSEN